MRNEFNIYCDESCHLENDKQRAMVLGAIWCPKENARTIFEEIREIKKKHGLSASFEIKWNKVSPAKGKFYSDLISYFFNNDDLHFRALVVPDKNVLDHSAYEQSHDDFYYKMYFDLLKIILDPESSYHIFLDIKDTQSQKKVDHLKVVLRNNHYDYHKEIIRKVQQVRSHEIELIQLTDLLIGAVSYLHRGFESSSVKKELIEEIRSLSGYSLLKSTLPKETKMNIFIWKSRKELNR